MSQPRFILKDNNLKSLLFSLIPLVILIGIIIKLFHHTKDLYPILASTTVAYLSITVISDCVKVAVLNFNDSYFEVVYPWRPVFRKKTFTYEQTEAIHFYGGKFSTMIVYLKNSRKKLKRLSIYVSFEGGKQQMKDLSNFLASKSITLKHNYYNDL